MRKKETDQSTFIKPKRAVATHSEETTKNKQIVVKREWEEANLKRKRGQKGLQQGAEMVVIDVDEDMGQDRENLTKVLEGIVNDPRKKSMFDQYLDDEM